MKKACLSIALSLCIYWGNTQTFKNLDFESNGKDGLQSVSIEDCHWTKSWGSENCCTIEKAYDNAFLSIVGTQENAVGFIEQKSEIALEDAAILEVSASIKTKVLAGRGAGLNVGVYDEAGNLLATKDMGGFYSDQWRKGIKDWHPIKVEMVIPEDARHIIGNSKTILMGKSTFGLTTGNGAFNLSDGSVIRLASTKMVDRNGKVYTSSIEPDIKVDLGKMESGVLIGFAIDWIRRWE